ncbi:MAG: glycoside hydrolase family 16 protein [Bacteroidales bacterium]
MLNNYKIYILLIIFIFIRIPLFPQSFDFKENIQRYIHGPYSKKCHRIPVYLTDYEYCNNNEYILSFEDNFDGSTLDETKWEIKNGVIRDFEFSLAKQWFKPENIEVSDGTLKLWARTEMETHTYWDPNQPNNSSTSYFKFGGAEIWSKQKFLHGKYEIKCRMPEGDGLWPAFWTYGERKSELDVFDNIAGVEDIRCGPGYDFDNDGGDGEGCRREYENPPDLTEWHTFTLIYDYDKIIWKIDGNECI